MTSFRDTVAQAIHEVRCCGDDCNMQYSPLDWRQADAAIAVFVKRLRERYTADATDFADELESEVKP